MHYPNVRIWASRLLGKAVYGTAVMAIAVTACGDASDRNANLANRGGQTIARVNGQEITTGELEAELRHRGPIEPEERETAARSALRGLVQRTVLAQKAVSLKLDRTPKVMMELRRNRTEVLAHAYLTETLSRQLPISRVEVEDFVEQHPHYFSMRKYYVFDQILIEKKLVTDEVMSAIEDLVTLEQVEQALERLKVPFSRRLNSNVGNQFSRKMATTLDALEPDEIFFIKTRDFAVVSRIIGIRPQPVSGSDAREVAERLLASKRNASASTKIIQDVVIGAEIDFFGEFSGMRVLDAEPAKNGALSPGSPSEAKDEPENGNRGADANVAQPGH